MYNQIADRPPVTSAPTVKTNQKKASPRRYPARWWIVIVATIAAGSASLNSIGWLGGEGGIGGLAGTTDLFGQLLIIATAMVMVIVCIGFEAIACFAPMLAGFAIEPHQWARRIGLWALALACAYGWNFYSAEKALAYRNHFAVEAVDHSFAADRKPLAEAVRAKEDEIVDLMRPVTNPYKVQLDAINRELATLPENWRTKKARLIDQQYMAAHDMRMWDDDHASNIVERKAFATMQLDKAKADLDAIDAKITEAKSRAGIDAGMMIWLALLIETVKLFAVWAGSVYNRNGRAAGEEKPKAKRRRRK